MKKIYLNLRAMVMLLCMFVGVSAWAETVKYTVESTSSVLTSGDAPSGSTVSYASTYSSKCQLTSGKKMTLTLKGFSGKKITSVKLSMKSNKYEGAGYLNIQAATTTLATIGSSENGLTFDDEKWNGSYTSSYTDITPTILNSSYVIQEDEDVVIIIGATTSSLYCQSFELTYETVIPSTPEDPIVLQDPTNTIENAYTIAEAKAIIDASDKFDLTKEVYVKGIVSQIDSYNSSYNSITYWISADGSKTDQFEVYSGLGMEGNEFASKNDVALGAEVIIKGIIKNYNNTYEFDKNNRLVSYVAPANPKTQTEITVSASSATAYTDNLNDFTAPSFNFNIDATEITYSSSNQSVATIAADGKVTILSTGETTISASCIDTEAHTAASASYTLIVNNISPVYVERVIVAEKDGFYYAATTTVDNNKLESVKVDVVNGEVVYNGTENIVWKWNEKYGQLINEATNKKLSIGSSTGKTYVNYSGTNSTWQIDSASGLVNKATNTRALFYNRQYDCFGNYVISSNLNKSYYSGPTQLLPLSASDVIGTITCADDNYYTFAASVNYNAPAGAYVGTIAGDEITVTSITEGTVIEGGKGILVKGKAGDIITIKMTTDPATEGITNDFVGFSVPTTLDTENNAYYVFAQATGYPAGFYRYTGSSIPAKKAYIAVSKTESAKLRSSYIINSDTETAIEAVTKQEKSQAYDLMGRCVGEGYKGIVIRNGKKELMK